MLGADEPTAPSESQERARRPELKRYLADGTIYMVLGTLVAGLANYAYQLLGGRALGPEDFAPVSALMTIHFLTFIVVLLPVEQLIIRSISLYEDVDRAARRAATITIGLTALAAGLLAVVGTERLFAGVEGFIVLAAAIVLAHGWFVIGRGNLAGHRYFRSYGVASAGASLLKLAFAGVVLLVAGTPFAVAAALVVGPLIIGAWGKRSWWSSPAPVDEEAAAGRFLSTFILAAAASQVLLLAGPLVAALLGATPREVSIIFVTFTLARVPLVFGYNLVARVLPPFTNLAKVGFDQELNWWVRRLSIGGLALAIPAGLLGALLGPEVIGLLFGEAFEPSSGFAALAAAGVMLGGASLFIGQVLVARGETGRLAAAWIAGLVVATIALAAVEGDISVRIGIAFVLGEIAAMLSLAALATRRIK